MEKMTALTYIFIVILQMLRFDCLQHTRIPLSRIHKNSVKTRGKKSQENNEIMEKLKGNDVNIDDDFFLPHLLEKMIFKWLLSQSMSLLLLLYPSFSFMSRAVDSIFPSLIFTDGFCCNFAWFWFFRFLFCFQLLFTFSLKCLWLLLYRNIWFKFMDSISECLKIRDNNKVEKTSCKLKLWMQHKLGQMCAWVSFCSGRLSAFVLS